MKKLFIMILILVSIIFSCSIETFEETEESNSARPYRETPTFYEFHDRTTDIIDTTTDY